MNLKLRLVALISCLLATCSSPQTSASNVIAIVGATLIDGTEADPLTDAVVLVTGSKIAAAGSRSSVEVPAGAETVDATGKTIIPGLIDLHTHYSPCSPDTETTKRELAFQLAYGVTTARSIGLDTAETIEAIEAVRSGAAPGPRVFTAGRGFTAPGGVPMQYGIDQPRQPETMEQAREGVREVAAQGADFIKVWVDSAGGTIPRIRPEILRAIVDEARKQDIPVAAHVTSRESVDELLTLGVTDFLHTLANQEPEEAEFIEALKRHGASFTPTLTGHDLAWLLPESPGMVENDWELKAVLGPKLVANLADPSWREERLSTPNLEGQKARLTAAQHFVAHLHSQGVTILVGSDCGVPLIPHGWGTHHEMQLLAEAGIAPLEVIRLATGRTAKRLGWTEFGTIVPRAAADMILLEDDPLEDIENTRRISGVMQGGEWIDRESLLKPENELDVRTSTREPMVVRRRFERSRFAADAARVRIRQVGLQHEHAVDLPKGDVARGRLRPA